MVTDLEDSTWLWEHHPDLMEDVVLTHAAVVRDAVELTARARRQIHWRRGPVPLRRTPLRRSKLRSRFSDSGRLGPGVRSVSSPPASASTPGRAGSRATMCSGRRRTSRRGCRRPVTGARSWCRTRRSRMPTLPTHGSLVRRARAARHPQLRRAGDRPHGDRRRPSGDVSSPPRGVQRSRGPAGQRPRDLRA